MNYEEYMRSILGYSNYNCDDVYNMYEQPKMGIDESYYYTIPNIDARSNINIDLTNFYPETYKVLYPIVCKVCTTNSNRQITKELLEEMTDEVYKNFEPEDKVEINSRINLKNGDVRNPNVKEAEPTKETRQRNYLLRDLIQILLLNKFGESFIRPIPPPPVRPPYFTPQPPRPQYGRPPFGNMPPPPPPRPRPF